MSWPKTSDPKVKALLISPYEGGKIASNDAIFPFPSLTLPLLASAFPATYRVRIIDERIRRVRGTEDGDIVFITTLTSTAPRAYQLARRFRQRGVPVIIGGVHATVCPEEARDHATSVVAGEAEALVPRILSDFEKGRLASLYANETLAELSDIPNPSLHLLNWRHRLFLSPIQTSRGCPHACDFCSVPRISGRKLRMKSTAAIEKELAYLKRFRSRKLFVVDDNFTLNKNRASELMGLFKRFGFKWMAFSNLSVVQDEEYLQTMSETGCVSLFIGFESLHCPDKLNKNRSFDTPAAMARAVQQIHQYGIGIQGSFVFGFDHDSPEVFRETVSFIQDVGIELPTLSILTPFPGTPLFDEMKTQKRMINSDWSLFDMNHVVFEPKNMSPEELQQGYAWALKYTSAPTSILTRVTKKTKARAYFLTAGFSLHRAQTRLALSLWNPNVQHLMQEKNLCRC